MPKQVRFVIPDVAEGRVAEAMQGLFPIPLDKVTGAPLYTPSEWIGVKINETLVDWVYLHEQRRDSAAAKKAVVRDKSVMVPELP